MSLNSNNDCYERYFAKETKILLNKKRNNDNVNTEKSSIFRNDNLKIKCKRLVIDNVMQFINNKIYKAYKGNIGDGLLTKNYLN